jgi:hypothetical protein
MKEEISRLIIDNSNNTTPQAIFLSNIVQSLALHMVVEY